MFLTKETGILSGILSTNRRKTVLFTKTRKHLWDKQRAFDSRAFFLFANRTLAFDWSEPSII